MIKTAIFFLFVKIKKGKAKGKIHHIYLQSSGSTEITQPRLINHCRRGGNHEENGKSRPIKHEIRENKKTRSTKYKKYTYVTQVRFSFNLLQTYRTRWWNVGLCQWMKLVVDRAGHCAL